MNPHSTLTCPHCQGSVPLYVASSRVSVCPHCHGGVLVDGQTVSAFPAPTRLAEIPSLMKLHSPFLYHSKSYLPIGQVRYDYGRGTWDKWWVLNKRTRQCSWWRVDEGDYAQEEALDIALFPAMQQDPAGFKQMLTLNSTLELQHPQEAAEKLKATAVGVATCVGFEGELPILINYNTRFNYVHLSGTQQRLYTVEITGDALALYRGRWIDPFLLKTYA